MRVGDKQLGAPQVLYKDTKANIQSMTVESGAFAYATDTSEMGYYDGSTWHWYSMPTSGTGIVGSGTANTIPKFTGVNAIGDSVIKESGNKVGINTSPSATLDIVPVSSSDTVFRTKSLQSTAPLGSELVGNGNFSTVPDTSWTWGTGWAHDTTNFEADHTAGNTAALTQSVSVTNGQTYQISITIKNRTAGSITLDINGVYLYNYGSVNNFTSNDTYTNTLVANITGMATLSITPTSDFNGSVDDISVKRITNVSQPNIVLLDDTGSVACEIRANYSLFTLGIGQYALSNNTTAVNNLAIGWGALYKNTTGYWNTAIGAGALLFNTIGKLNLAVGTNALYRNTSGYYNMALGANALYQNTTGYYNVAIGSYAGYYISSGGANQTSNNSIYLGYNTKALANGDTNEIVIGANVVGFGSNTIAYGNSSITKHIFQAGNIGLGTTTPGGSSTTGTCVISIANGTAPVGGVANQVSLFSADVSSSAELFAMDEAGNTPQLTPHPSNFLDTLPTQNYEYPWAYTSTNAFLGKKITVDMMGAIRAIEKLSNKKFIYLENLPPEEIIDWDTIQEKYFAESQDKIAKAKVALDNIQKLLESESDLDKIRLLQEMKNDIVIPEPYIKKSPPNWMKMRGVKSKL